VVASTALLAIGGWLVITGTLTLGQLVAAELIVTTVVSSVAKMGKHLESFYDLTASVHKLGTLLDLPTERLGGEHHPPPAEGRGSALRLSNLSWLLPNGVALFENVSIELPAGGNLGITGRSGSGKSTLVELIWGLRRPSTGHVQLDGRDVRDLSLDSLRQTIGIASRIEIVTDSLRENVRLGRPYVDDEAVREALRAVGLLDRLSELPEGLDTPMHTVGHPLAEGEIRLLMIARAIAGAPSLLVVEDLLDGLSAERREVALRALLDPAASWSLVLVSTLPDVLERCDQVLELPGGVLRADSPPPRQNA
jgi:ABC-type bacteriocin/lantibiotic exporter with double-glycine peptidase domain